MLSPGSVNHMAKTDLRMRLRRYLHNPLPVFTFIKACIVHVPEQCGQLQYRFAGFISSFGGRVQYDRKDLIIGQQCSRPRTIYHIRQFTPFGDDLQASLFCILDPDTNFTDIRIQSGLGHQLFVTAVDGVHILEELLFRPRTEYIPMILPLSILDVPGSSSCPDIMKSNEKDAGNQLSKRLFIIVCDQLSA